MAVVQQKTLELEKNTSLDWRMQSIENELNTLQVKMQGGNPNSSQDRLITQLAQKVQELSQNPLWHEMQKTTVEVQQIKEKFNPVMKDIEIRLKRRLETSVEDQSTEEKFQNMKEKFHPVMQDIERRFISLESRPVETTLSNVLFAEEPNPATMTTLIERIQVLESKVNNLEPSLSTLHSSISSTPLEPPEDMRKREGSTNEPSSSQEMSLEKRIDVIESWVRSSGMSPASNTFGYTIGELEGRLLKRIQTLESQLTQMNLQELPNRQKELEVKIGRLLQTDELPSFGTSSSLRTPTSHELRLNKMEISHEELMTESKRLHTRLTALEQSRSATTIIQITDRLDNVIRVVNNHESENHQVGQSSNDIQQELMTLRQTVDAWNNDEEVNEENHQQDATHNDLPDLPLQEVTDNVDEPPPGLARPASIARIGIHGYYVHIGTTPI